jgi:ATP-dependent protease ClpP protease subunit
VAVSWSDESPTHKVDAYVRGARAKMDEYARVLGRRTKRKAVFWRSLFKSGEDRYFTAHEAVELGLADAVWKERT